MSYDSICSYLFNLLMCLENMNIYTHTKTVNMKYDLSPDQYFTVTMYGYG